MKWIRDLFSPKTREWEEFYRNRWSHDRKVRSTHGVNCSGGCSWEVYVKDGIVTWEMQATDYPAVDPTVPPYEPRGCQRGASFSWYLYSPQRVKHPYVRGSLLEMWRQARATHGDPVDAWAAIQSDPALRGRYQRARGKGGFQRATLAEAIELAAAATVHTIKAHGPDRVAGYSPAPAASQLGYAAGSRYLSLLGGTMLSWYDWHADLPPGAVETWGEQADVAESADWYHARMVAVVGSNPNATRTPDCHYLVEARHNGTKLVAFSPELNATARQADQWVAINEGQDGAFWLAVGHVVLSEHYAQIASTPRGFADYARQFSDAPMLVELEADGDGHRAGRFVRADRLPRYASEALGDWKFVVLDDKTGEARMPGGSAGHRWSETGGRWNLELVEATSGAAIEPALTLLGNPGSGSASVAFQQPSGAVVQRAVPCMTLRGRDGQEVVCTTVFDLLIARYGVARDGLAAEGYAADLDDAATAGTPAWQEALTGVARSTVIHFAREWAATALVTDGSCSVIVGPGVNHRYHNDLTHRAIATALVLTGCIGRNGGGLHHYGSQSKVAPQAAWSAVAFAEDWGGPARQQNAASWFYVHGDQWKYEAGEAGPLGTSHTIDAQARAARSGWLPQFPQFGESSLETVKKARAAGATSDDAIVSEAVGRLKSGDLALSIDDPDAEPSWPRVWFTWGGDALEANAHGQEYLLRHLLGTHDNAIGAEKAEGAAQDVTVGPSPRGKLDLVVTLDFRMSTTAVYADVVLPSATFYERDDLNTTELHSFIHPLSAAVSPAWESQGDWVLFRELARRTGELGARHLPEIVDDLVMTPLRHDTADEVAQAVVADWRAGECEPVPGHTMGHLSVVRRRYGQLFNRFCALGPGLIDRGVSARGVTLDVTEQYDELVERGTTVEIDGAAYPAMSRADQAANVVLHLAPETNGEVAYKGFRVLEARTGLDLGDLADAARHARVTFRDLQSQPRRVLTSPCWSGIVHEGRTYAPFTMQVERLVPWRTLTGRQSLYLDHPAFLAADEHLPTWKPSPGASWGDLDQSDPAAGVKLAYLTPHGRWSFDTAFSDNERMLTLSRGRQPLWLSVADAAELGVADNDWVEVHNDHGVVCTRAAVSHRIPRGLCMLHAGTPRTLDVPRSPIRDGRRGGGDRSLTRARLKPTLMVGGYGQLTYDFNYWGPTGVTRDTSVLVRKLDQVDY